MSRSSSNIIFSNLVTFQNIEHTLSNFQLIGSSNRFIVNDIYPFLQFQTIDGKLIYKFLAYTGVTCVDFKICDGKLKIFEINPRFGGTVVKNNMIEPMIDKLCEIISKK